MCDLAQTPRATTGGNVLLPTPGTGPRPETSGRGLFSGGLARSESTRTRDDRREVIADESTSDANEQLFLAKLLRFDLDFGQVDCDVVIRPLIVKESNHGQRNNERADKCCCERFHQAYSSLSFSTAAFAIVKA